MKKFVSLFVVAILALVSIAVATDIDLTQDGTGAISAFSKGKSFVLKKTIDFSASSQIETNTLSVFDIPAGTFVEKVAYQVETAEGETITFDIGDDSDVDGYVDGANLNSTGYGTSALAFDSATTVSLVYESDGSGTLATQTVVTAQGAVTGYTEGKLYTVADTIDVLLIGTNTVDAAKLKLTVTGFEVE